MISAEELRKRAYAAQTPSWQSFSLRMENELLAAAEAGRLSVAVEIHPDIKEVALRWEDEARAAGTGLKFNSIFHTDSHRTLWISWTR